MNPKTPRLCKKCNTDIGREGWYLQTFMRAQRNIRTSAFLCNDCSAILRKWQSSETYFCENCEEPCKIQSLHKLETENGEAGYICDKCYEALNTKTEIEVKLQEIENE